MTRVPMAALLLAALLMPASADATPRKPPPKKPAVPGGEVAGAPTYGPRDDVRSFAAAVAARRGIDGDWLVRQLAQARRIDTVQRLMMPAPAGTAKDWGAYRDRFVEPRRIAAGATFWRANEAALQRAESRWGVPPEIVVAIVGVETFYGRMTGNFRVIDALATLSFDFPTGRKNRSAFFRGELEEFLVLCQREGLDPQMPKGSFAGAMGLAQFMPGSINRYAIDFDDDGHVDLAGSASDAIGSIAHYLAEFGWQRGLPAYHEVTPPAPGDELSALLGPDIVPSFSAAQFTELGALLADTARSHAGPLALVMLENGTRPPSYVAGTQNFYVITRYNWSSYYALAVVTLAEAVKRAR